MKEPSAFDSLGAIPSIACVDVGASKISVRLASRAGFGEPVLEPTEKSGRSDAVARQILRMVSSACTRSGVTMAGLDTVGLASCGPFRRVEGMIELITPNLCGGLGGPAGRLPNDWTRLPLQALLAPELPNLRIGNDAVAALMAERRWGTLSGSDHCAYLTWSTGIGVGLCVDGRVLAGRHGNAGHAGHMVVDDDTQHSVCGCGALGDVEAQAGGAALERRLGMPASRLFDLDRQGDPDAASAIDSLCRVVGRMLANLIVTLDLERVAIGGSLFWNNRERLLPGLTVHASAGMPMLGIGACLVPAGLGAQVGDYGALALALSGHWAEGSPAASRT